MVDQLLEPRLSWRELLRNSIVSSAKNDYRLIPPNKRHIWRGIYLPSSWGEDVEVAFIVDSSGSMSNDELRDGLSELKGICEQFDSYRIWFAQCDWDLQELIELNPYNFEFAQQPNN